LDTCYFNKSRTNVLFKRPRSGLPFLMCVDHDLEYRGPDRTLSRAFKAGVAQQGWRALPAAVQPQADLNDAVAKALNVLGFEGGEPTLSPSVGRHARQDRRGLLATLGTDLSRTPSDADVLTTVGRAEEIDELASCVLRCGQARAAVVVGASGVGKSHLLRAAALRLARLRQARRLISVHLGQMLAGTLFDAERENLLVKLLEEAANAPDTVLALEHLELALLLPHGALLLAQHVDRSAALIGTILPDQVERLAVEPLVRRIHVVSLAELSARDTVVVLKGISEQVARRHGVEIGEPCLGGCVHAARSIPGRLPAKAIALLDAAGARAELSGASAIRPDEIYFAASRLTRGANPTMAD
jgi:ATP-dependent Clp protease ATP-binding subunit ClpA